MTEKRFVMRYGKYIDTVENIEYDEKWESWKIVELLNTLSDENEQLKKELFEARKDYILETYADNPIRRDERLKALEKELQRND